jgi:hypothetical protein
MPRAFFGIIAVITGSAVVAFLAPALTLGIVACAAAAGLLWLCSQCRHSGPLGLLPPVLLADGTRTPAQWFCSACGKSWPAGFDHDRTPVVRYAGFDQTKAPAAARRASVLEKKMQELAVRRAGTRARTPAARSATPSLAASTIVSIQNGRRTAAK